MQITPIVVKEWSSKKGYPDERSALLKEFGSRIQAMRMTVEQSIFDPEINLVIGCWYLHYLQNRYAAQPLMLPMALAAYNAGPTKAEAWLHRDRYGETSTDAASVDEYLDRIDYPATREYVKNIIIRYDSYKRANSGL